MKRGATWTVVITWLIGLTAVGVFLWVVLSPAGELADPILQNPGQCSLGKEVVAECFCDGQKIDSGWCCQSGRSDTPCGGTT